MYPASTATILRLFYNNTADVTHDTLWSVGGGQRLSDGRSRIFLSPARPIPFTTRTKHSSVWSVLCCRPRTHVGIYRGGWSQEVSPQPAGELARVSRGAHGSRAAWQLGATCQHVTRKFPVGGGRGRGEHQQLAAVAGPILQPAGEIRSPAAPARRHQSTSQQSQHNYGEMNLIS